MMRGQQLQDHASRAFYELSTLVLNMIRSPPSPVPFSDHPFPTSPVRTRSPVFPTQITPAGFASLLLGISLALMLCGSVTFFIGFMLMPWVLGLVMVFYIVGIVSSFSVLWRSIFRSLIAPSSPRKDIPGCTFLPKWSMEAFLKRKVLELELGTREISRGQFYSRKVGTDGGYEILPRPQYY